MGSVALAADAAVSSAPLPRANKPPAHNQAAKTFSTVSQISFAYLLGQILRRAHRQRHNRQRRILRATRDKAAAINDKQILDVVALIPLVQHTRFRIVS